MIYSRVLGIFYWTRWFRYWNVNAKWFFRVFFLETSRSLLCAGCFVKRPVLLSESFVIGFFLSLLWWFFCFFWARFAFYVVCLLFFSFSFVFIIIIVYYFLWVDAIRHCDPVERRRFQLRSRRRPNGKPSNKELPRKSRASSILKNCVFFQKRRKTR